MAGEEEYSSKKLSIFPSMFTDDERSSGKADGREILFPGICGRRAVLSVISDRMEVAWRIWENGNDSLHA